MPSSSGTTGKPIVVGYTKHDMAVWSDCIARLASMAGVVPGDRVQMAFGYGMFTGGFGLHYGCMKLGCTMIPAGSGNTERHIQMIEDYEAAGGRMEFGKIDFNDSSLAACRSSEFLMSRYHYMNVGDGYHELAILGTSKGIGGRAFIDALPFAPSRVYAFGDSENDLAILAEADVAVVMGNARDNVKAHADYVTDVVTEDGVATALEHFGLI